MTADRAPIRRCSGHMKALDWPLSGENVPQRAGMAEDFHRAGGCGGESCVEKQDRDLGHGVSSSGWLNNLSIMANPPSCGKWVLPLVSRRVVSRHYSVISHSPRARPVATRERF